MNRPADRDQRSVHSFLSNVRPLLEGEDDFIRRKEDLVTLRPGRESAWLDKVIEKVLHFIHCKPIEVSTGFPNKIPQTNRRFSALVHLLLQGWWAPLPSPFCPADMSPCALPKGQKEKSNDDSIRYFSKERVNCFVTTILTIVILVLLVLPIYGLYRLSDNSNTLTSNAICIGVLLVFTLVFSVVLSLFTKARRHEILGASAA